MKQGHRRAIFAAFVANFSIAVAKFAGFVATGATSLLAEAVHSLADTGNQALLLLGAARARQKATAEHPFGYGRERYFWAFVVAMVLFSLGSLFAILKGIEKLEHPHPLESPAWAIGILLFALGIEGCAFHTAVREAQKVRGDESWMQFIRRAKSPELPVILLEDIGALLGLIIALLAVGLTSALDDPRIDAWGSIAIGTLLGGIAIVLAIEMKSLLIGESAAEKMQSEIRSVIETSPQVNALIHLRTLHLGPDELLVAAKLEFAAELDFAAVARTINEIEANIRRSVPIARVIYLEPAIGCAE